MTLIENTLFGVRNKVDVAVKRLRHYEPPDGYYLAFSGGKDSVVIEHLARRAGVKFDTHYQVTTVDPPELMRFMRQHYPAVHWERPELTMWQLIVKKKTPPTRRSRYCCEWLKERGGTGRQVITGIRWAESPRRKKTRQMIEGCLRSNKGSLVHPIIDWDDGDVWEYIHDNSIPYCCLYGEGFSRLGCVGCPMADKKRLQEFERWPRFYELYMRAFEKMLEARKAANMPTPHWTDAQSVMRWWLELAPTADDEQLSLFD